MDKINEEAGYEKIKHIGVDELIETHDEAIKFGETWHTGIRDRGSIYHMSRILRNMVNLRRDKVSIAAKLVTFIIKEHPFWDGNHRSAFETAQKILRSFNCEMVVTKNEAERFIKSIDKCNLKERTVKNWIKKHLRPI